MQIVIDCRCLCMATLDTHTVQSSECPCIEQVANCVAVKLLRNTSSQRR